MMGKDTDTGRDLITQINELKKPWVAERHGLSNESVYSFEID